MEVLGCGLILEVISQKITKASEYYFELLDHGACLLISIHLQQSLDSAALHYRCTIIGDWTFFSVR